MIIYKPVYPCARITAVSSQVHCITDLHDMINSRYLSFVIVGITCAGVIEEVSIVSI